MAIITIQSITKSYGAHLLFDGVTISIEDKEILGVIGPNGSGKSTLLKILNGSEPFDDGNRIINKGVSIGYIEQKDDLPDDITVEDYLYEKIKELGIDDYSSEAKIARLLRDADFENPKQLIGTLSGGWKKRVSICAVLLSEPNLILCDEPTNHLDLEGVLWLEKIFSKKSCAVVMVSHDRWFLDSVANRIIEINPQYPEGFLNTSGTYSDFLERRVEYLASQEKLQMALANKYKAEAEWLRRRPKARTTKSVSRIKDADKLKTELDAVKWRNSQNKTAEIEFASSGRKTNDLIIANNISKTLGDKELFKNFEIEIAPKEVIGIVGINGSGKTTLLKVLSKDMRPDNGSVNHAFELKTVYFDQERKKLDQTKSLRMSLSDNGKTVTYQGKSKHINSWAKKFLFSQDDLDKPLSTFSGGEQARVYISSLMQQEADVLLLDEPTNDLDIQSLEVLEESLHEFPGAVIVISHDRYLMDKICTKFIAIDNNEDIDVVADYYQWEQLIETRKNKKTEKIKKESTPKTEQKISWEEQKELRNIEKKIATLEQKIESERESLENCDSDYEKAAKLLKSVEEKEGQLEVLFDRWQELEDKL